MIEIANTKKISEIRSGAGIPFLTPEVSPGTHCPMRMASHVVEDIQGLSSLLVGMNECTTHSRMFSPYPEGKNGELHWLYTLDSNEVVFGSREGVMDALREMDKKGAKHILLMATCIPDLIGEDFEGLLQEIQPELTARVAFIMLGQFKNVSYPPGSWKTLKALATLMQSKTTVKNQINVLGRSPSEENIPLPHIFKYLENKDCKIRYIGLGSSMKDFCDTPDASLNIVISPYTQPLAVEMKKKFNIPFISLHDAYSVEDINNRYQTILKHLGINDENIFNDDKNKALELQQRAIQVCKKLKFILALRIDLPLQLTCYLIKTLDMIPLLVHLEEYYSEDEQHSQTIQSLGYNPKVC